MCKKDRENIMNKMNKNKNIKVIKNNLEKI